jgi:hypothetical protein
MGLRKREKKAEPPAKKQQQRRRSPYAEMDALSFDDYVDQVADAIGVEVYDSRRAGREGGLLPEDPWKFV